MDWFDASNGYGAREERRTHDLDSVLSLIGDERADRRVDVCTSGRGQPATREEKKEKEREERKREIETT